MRVFFQSVIVTIMLAALPAFAQTPPAAPAKLPPLPAPLQALQQSGAQMRYLGNEGGLDGWIAIQNGQEQYFYVTPDQSSFVLGLQFDKNGKVITLRQVQALQKASGSDVLNTLAGGMKPDVKDPNGKAPVRQAFKTPSEQLYSDMEASNWITLGNSSAPYIYMILDPQCPYCEKFIHDLKPGYLDTGKLQVRAVMVGIHGPDSVAQAAFLLAANNPQDLLYRNFGGDKSALPSSPQINTQGVERNLAIMQSWKLNGTPTTVYRGRNGTVKIVQGPAKDIPALLADVAVSGGSSK